MQASKHRSKASDFLRGRQEPLKRLWPGFAAGGGALVIFVFLGQTPLLRALGMALVIFAIALTLRRLGAALAVIGGLALAFSPAFWSQVGAPAFGSRETPLLPIALLVIAGGVAALTWFMPNLRLGRRPSLAIQVAIVIGFILFSAFFGTPRSLRLTTMLTAWLLYLLMDGLILANPRPEDPPDTHLGQRHTWGLLLLMTAGIGNDPLFTLVAPAVVLGLLLTHRKLPVGYWALMAVVILIGLRGIALQYVDSTWSSYPAAQAEALNIRLAYIFFDGWRESSRWLDLFGLVAGQFTVIGVALGIIGLARLSRWYPSLGTVTMVAYAAYAVFGLVYFGKDSAILLLPLLMIQVIWMTYAVYAFGQWLQRSFQAGGGIARWFAPAAFVLLPLLMLLRIMGVYSAP